MMMMIIILPSQHIHIALCRLQVTRTRAKNWIMQEIRFRAGRIGWVRCRRTPCLPCVQVEKPHASYSLALYVEEMFYPKLSEITSTVTEYIRLSLQDLHFGPPAEALLCALCRTLNGNTLQCVCYIFASTKLCIEQHPSDPTFVECSLPFNYAQFRHNDYHAAHTR